MKWVKVAIGAVIAIISIGIIATSVYGMTQEKVREEVVTFEILTHEGYIGTLTNGTYQSISNYSVTDVEDVLNIITIKLNGIEEDLSYKNLQSTGFLFGITSVDMIIDNSDNYDLDDGTVTVGDTFEITFEVTQPPQLTGISATLILLTPLIFAGGVLAYLLNKQEV